MKFIDVPAEQTTAVTDGFLASLDQKEILLYFFLVLVSDRNGLSYYAYDSICSFQQITLDQYVEARDSLIDKDLIAFDGSVFQVLSLPEKPVVQQPKPLKTTDDVAASDPTAIQQLIENALAG